MKQRFESWIIEHEKTYRDEEEKAMRFELFKAALEMMESQLPSVEESGVLPQVSCFADFAAEEKRKLLAFPNGVNITEYNEMVKSAWAKQQKGLFFCNLFILEYALASLVRMLLYPFCF